MKQYQTSLYCPNCKQETVHDVTDWQHERDRSNDRSECTVCHFYWSGMTGKYYPPEGFKGKKVLFLDFDGVLNDSGFVQNALKDVGPIAQYTIELAQTTLDPARVAKVQHICDVTGADVVLVTGWRRWAKFEELCSALKFTGLTAPVIDKVGGVKMSGDLRRWATAEWLEENPAYTRHVVLDDDTNLWQDWNGKKNDLICVHPFEGIEDKHVAQVIGILGSKDG